MSSLAANASPMRRTAACRRPRSRTATSRRCCACSMRLRRSRASSSSSPASGRTSRTAKMLRWATSAARKPIGARQASTAQTSPKTCSWSVGRDAARRRLAQDGAAGVEDAAGDERGRRARELGQAEPRGAGQRAGRTAGPTACQASGIEKSRRSNDPRPRSQSEQPRQQAAPRRPGAAPQPGGSEHEHRDQHELRRQHVAGADRELDAGRGSRRGRRARPRRPGRSRSWRRGATAGRPRPRGRAPRTTISADELAARQAPRPPCQDSSSRRSAAASLRMSSFVLTVSGYRSPAQEAAAPVGPGRGPGQPAACQFLL